MQVARRHFLAGGLSGLLPHAVSASAGSEGAWNQTALDRLAVELAGEAPIVAARDALADLLRSDLPASEPRIEHAAAEIAFGQVQSCIQSVLALPVLYQNTAPAHRRAGLDIPSGKFAMSNPDTLFRSATLDPLGRYIVEGQLRRPSAYLSVHLYGQSESTPAKGQGVLFDRDIVRDDHGRFTIAIGPEEWASSAPNRLTTAAGASNLVVRDTLADWSSEAASCLKLHRIGGQAPAVMDRASLVRTIAEGITKAGPSVIKFRRQQCLARPANTLEAPGPHLSGRWALISTGHFSLAAEDALVLNVDQMGADYLGFQTADLATGTLEPDWRSSTLNHRQARRDPDGRFTFVLSPFDPGCENWIDTAGQQDGLIMLRWQGLPQHLPSDLPAPRAQRVPRHKVRGLAPALRSVSPETREQQREQRRTSFHRRFSSI